MINKFKVGNVVKVRTGIVGIIVDSSERLPGRGYTINWSTLPEEISKYKCNIPNYETGGWQDEEITELILDSFCEVCESLKMCIHLR